MNTLLDVRNLTMKFGGLTAVNDVSFVVNEGEIVSLIGPNGAGKTTVFNAITGVYDPTSGRNLFNGKRLTKLPTWKTYAGFAAIGAASGLGLMSLLNIQEMWDAAISMNYTYQADFPWAKSISDLWAYLGNLPLSFSTIPALTGFVVGSLGARSAWMQSRRTPDVITRGGIARTFQNIRLFRDLTALENILVGMDIKLSSSYFDGVFHLPREHKEFESSVRKGKEMLAFVGLERAADLRAGSLPYGHQRRLEIARALASSPKLLLLDEPAAGMNPSESEELMELIFKIRDSGVTILLIEHHMKVVMGISDRIVVLDYGNKIAEGTPQEVRSNPKVIAAYLGKEGGE